MSTAALHSFPGMPLLTYQVKRRLRRHACSAPLRVETAPFSANAHRAEQVYAVYVGSEMVGRFTVRGYDGFVERNFFCLLPELSSVRGAMLEGAFGVAGPRWADALRTHIERVIAVCRSLVDLLLLPWVRQIHPAVRPGSGQYP